jgi:phage-related baseplate assembly protein
MTEQYNGWANRETWALNLWLSNDEGLYNMTRERVADAIESLEVEDDEERKRYAARAASEAVRDLTEELFDPSEELMSAENIITILSDIGSLYRVDWDEIGAAWLPEDES